MLFRSFIMALVLGAGIAANVPVPAAAETMNWKFTNDTPWTLTLKLYSKSRNNVWPNAYNSWVLDETGPYDVPISCRRGEKICYGALNGRSQYWGVGDGDQGCESCCNICGSPGVKSYRLY